MHRACCSSYVKGLSIFSNVPSVPCQTGLPKLFQLRNFSVDRRLKNTGLLRPPSAHTSCIFPGPISFEHTRPISWSFKSQTRAADFNESPDNEQDVARAAILDKVMKGRQPTDLMLRCKQKSLFECSILS